MNEETTQTKFCKFCGSKIPYDAVICTACGRQVENLNYQQQAPQSMPNVIIHNANTNVNGMIAGRPKNKWVALILCVCLGFFGGHKFYEGKVGMGILYLFTCGLFTIGILVDFIMILLKPNPYYV
ncbi:MAG: NINE protein [Clostridiales bacterium]|nr:NINE protein [Clostridiales bacterium]